MSTCSKCESGFSVGQTIAVCNVCCSLFHATAECAGVSSSEIKVLEFKKKTPMLIYKCASCTSNGNLHPSIAECIVSLQKSTQELFGAVTTIKKVSSEVDSLRSEVQDMQLELGKIPVIERDIQDIKQSSSVEMLTVKERLDKLESSDKSLLAPIASVDSISAELQDRNMRMNNIIMYNVPENQTRDASADVQAVKANLKKVKDINLANIAVRRIGSAEGKEKPRPILVEMNSHRDVMRVVGNKRMLPRGIAVSTDKTKAQREQLKSLLAEMDRLNAEHGSRCKIVKYVDGVPAIIDYVPPSVRRDSAGGNRSPRAAASSPARKN